MFFSLILLSACERFLAPDCSTTAFLSLFALIHAAVFTYVHFHRSLAFSFLFSQFHFSHFILLAIFSISICSTYYIVLFECIVQCTVYLFFDGAHVSEYSYTVLIYDSRITLQSILRLKLTKTFVDCYFKFQICSWLSL